MTLLIYTSKTGNTKAFADFIIKNIDIEVGNFDSDITKHNKIVLGAYTWGYGKIPSDMKEFIIKNRDNWEGKEVFIFGSGLTIYPTFCKAVNSMKKIIEDCGGNVVGFFKFEQKFNESDYTERFKKRLISKIE